MITLNNKKFASDDNEFISSLFKAGGTCIGYYKLYKKRIKLFDAQKKLIGVVTINRVLATASKLDNGKFWYSYKIPSIIGNFDSYSAMALDIDKCLKLISKEGLEWG